MKQIKTVIIVVLLIFSSSYTEQACIQKVPILQQEQFLATTLPAFDCPPMPPGFSCRSTSSINCQILKDIDGCPSQCQCSKQ